MIQPPPWPPRHDAFLAVLSRFTYKHSRVCFLFLSKAFERIGYNVLIRKLLELDVRRCLIPWITSFLSNRKQLVKIGEAFSDWLPTNAGVPQGTKLVPLLRRICGSSWTMFLSRPECITKNGGASIQSSLDTVSCWVSMILMKLNAKER